MDGSDPALPSGQGQQSAQQGQEKAADLMSDESDALRRGRTITGDSHSILPTHQVIHRRHQALQSASKHSPSRGNGTRDSSLCRRAQRIVAERPEGMRVIPSLAQETSCMPMAPKPGEERSVPPGIQSRKDRQATATQMGIKIHQSRQDDTMGSRQAVVKNGVQAQSQSGDVTMMPATHTDASSIIMQMQVGTRDEQCPSKSNASQTHDNVNGRDHHDESHAQHRSGANCNMMETNVGQPNKVVKSC